MNGDSGLKLGCPVCGYGVDWSYYPEWLAIRTPAVLTSLVLGWMMWEYVCIPCHRWAIECGAEWDGKVKFGFTGFTGLTACSIDGPNTCTDSSHPRARLMRSRYAPGQEIGH